MSIETLILGVGYPFVFLFIAAECTGLPVPGGIAVLAAAAAAGAGKGFNIWLVFLFGATGAIIGSLAGYWIGRRAGRVLLDRISGRLWFNWGHFRKAEYFFSRHGGSTIFWGRWISYLRLLTSLLAGVLEMDFHKFLFYNVFGGIVWAGSVSFIGYKFGKHLDVVERIIGDVGIGLLVVAMVILAGYFVISKLFFPRGSSRQ